MCVCVFMCVRMCVCVYACVYMGAHLFVYMNTGGWLYICPTVTALIISALSSTRILRCDPVYYGVATMGRLLKIIGLFCKRAIYKKLHSAKETYNFKEPTNRSHPITHILLIVTSQITYLTWMDEYSGVINFTTILPASRITYYYHTCLLPHTDALLNESCSPFYYHIVCFVYYVLLPHILPT